MNDTLRSSRLRSPAAVLALALGPCLPTAAIAQAMPAPDGWRVGASIYGFLPQLRGTSSVPADPNGTPIEVEASQILDKLKMTFMGTLDVHNGRWGGFTDVLYLNLGDHKNQTRDFSIGNAGLPAGTTADIEWNLKGVIWTLAGQYRVVSSPSLTLDLLGGTRLFEMRQKIQWDITGSLGPIVGGGATGESNVKLSHWDAIAGVKGRYAIDEKWSVPFYADIGTGESSVTRQVAGGISYRFSWGELTGMYRYLGYRMKSGQVIETLSFHGPMIGATLRW